MQLTPSKKDGKKKTTVISISNQLKIQGPSSQQLSLEHNNTEGQPLREIYSPNLQAMINNPFSQAAKKHREFQDLSLMAKVAYKTPGSTVKKEDAIGQNCSPEAAEVKFFAVTQATCMIILYINYAALLQQPTTPSLWQGPNARFHSIFDENTSSITYSWIEPLPLPIYEDTVE
jgi:hypothetical protein